MERDALIDEIRVKRLKREELDEEIQNLRFELNEFTEINRLPSIVMREILRNLCMEDWFSFECVCRRWRQIVRAFADKPGLVITKVIEGKPRSWHSREPCSVDSTIVRLNLDFDPEHSFLGTLRKLKLTNRWEDRRSIRLDKMPLLTDLRFLNQLTCLEVLELEKFDLNEYSHYKNNMLTLPNLQHLTIRDLCSPIRLNTPALTSYRSRYLASWSAKFLFPDRITHLHLGKIGVGYDLKSFTNLEYLTFQKFHGVEDDETILDLPALKIISIRPDYRKGLQFELLRSRALQLLHKKFTKSKSDLKIVFFGIQLDDPGQLENFEYSPSGSYACNSGNHEELLKRNHSKLVDSELKFIKQITYSSSMELANWSAFYQKLSQVNQVCVYESGGTTYTSEKVDKLLRFLKNFKNLNSLIYQAPLVPSFFEKLLSAYPLLRSLVIETFEDRSEDYRLQEANEIQIYKVITKFEHLYKSFLSFSYERPSVDDLSGDVYEYHDIENGQPYIIKKLQFFHRSAKMDRYELYVHDGTNEPEPDDLFGDYKDLAELTEVLYKNFAD